jgi:hypothetical protein
MDLRVLNLEEGSQWLERTNLMAFIEHTFFALLIQALVGLTTRNWWAGAALVSGYFVGREFAQAEYRWIEQFGDGLRANLPWWGALDGQVWVRPDQTADWMGPVVATTAVAWAMARRRTSQV